MNKVNNKRRKSSMEKIENTFLELIQTKEINQVSVTDICKIAKLNRSTFYANYLDIYDLADKIREKLEQEVFGLYNNKNNYNHGNFLQLFKHIKDNQIFYKTYFKLGFDKNHIIDDYDYLMASSYYKKHVDYHIEFFKAGLNAIIHKWLNNGCKESPEEILEIIKEEYKK